MLEATGSLGLETMLGLAAGVVLALAAGGLLGRLPDWALERRFEGSTPSGSASSPSEGLISSAATA